MTAGTVSMIAAVSPDGVIGVGGRIPWHYPDDLRRFKRLTLGSTVIMGRRTWESMGGRPLPRRRNIVVTSADLEGVETARSLAEAIDRADDDVWLIGGARIYAEGMDHASVIDLTYVPDEIDDPEAVRFPPIDPARWIEGPLEEHDDPALRFRRYRRRDAEPG